MKGRWQLVSFFALSLPNRPGELARFADQLHGAGINLLGLWGYASGHGEPRLSCVPQVPGAFRRWAASSGLVIEESEALYLQDEDRPGALVETLDRIASAGINVAAVECVSSGDAFGWFLWADESDMEALLELLL
ncbi:MAG: hypothetical protein JSV91_12135 [Phycisphaerales bacterium]|nr:MAG: hypothetical protein JSV91_12135 [Phycisphaerales bacterium]